MAIKRILSAYGTSLLGVFSGLLTNLFLLKIITIYVSKTEYGLYAFIIQITAYFSVLQLGLDFALSRQIAEYLGKGENENASLSYWEVKRINRIGFIVVPILTIIAAILIWFKIVISNDETFELATILILLSGFVQTILFANRPNSAALIGSRNQAYVNIINVSRTIFATTLSILLLFIFKEIYLVLISEIISHIIAYFLLTKRLNKNCGWISKSQSNHEPQIFKNLIKFGGTSTLGGIAWTIEGTSDVIILGSFVNLQMVGLYVIWWRFPSMIFDFCTRLAFSSYPEFAESHARSVNDSKVLLSKIMFLSYFLSSLGFIGISFWLQPFIKIWFGNDYLPANGYLIAFLMGLLIFFRTFGNLLGLFWLSKGNANFTTLVSFLQSAIKVTIALLLVNNFNIVGIVTASIIAAAFQILALGLNLLKNNLLGLKHSIFFLFLTFISSLAIYLFKSYNIIVNNLSFLILGITTTILIWIIVYFGIILLSPFKEHFYLLINKIFKYKVL